MKMHTSTDHGHKHRDDYVDNITIETAEGAIFQFNENRDGSLNVRCITGTIAVRPVMTGRVEIVAL